MNLSKSYERRVSISCDQYFRRPLIIYKISSEVALKASINILAYTISKKIIECVFVEDECFTKYSCLENDPNFSKIKKWSELKQITKCTPDLCIIIGGDGTLLWANSLFGDYVRPPFLTFNLGTLGYMTYYNCDKYIDILDELLDNRKNNVIFEKRSTLSCKLITENDVEPEEEMIALNDVVLDRGPNSHLLNLEIYINNEPLTKVSGDGVLMASSTGSTAYSLSAGGTIIHYDVDCLLLNAICPHSLSFRPIAFPNNIELKILVCEGSSIGYINVDGVKKMTRRARQGIVVKVSDLTVNVILLEKFTDNPVRVWTQRLINQLGWNKAFKNENNK